MGTVFVMTSLMMIVASVGLKEELRRLFSSPPVAFLVSFAAVAMVLAVAVFSFLYGVRFLMGSFRQSQSRNGKA
jgi:hypothetical protein